MEALAIVDDKSDFQNIQAYVYVLADHNEPELASPITDTDYLYIESSTCIEW